MSAQAFRNLAVAAIVLFGTILLSACNFPGVAPTPDLFATAAAQTVAAQLTALAQTTEVPPSATVGEPTTTATPSATPPPTSTSTVTPTQIPCDRASFVTDMSYPDGTDVAPGTVFTKTWRLRNTGTCTWTSGYALVFDHGDSIGGAASSQLTTGTVAPNQTLDVSVQLTAPTTPGTYQGYWKLRNASGVLFGIGDGGTGAFWVKIDVVAPTTTVNLGVIAAESGSVRSNGSVLSVKNLGDTPDNFSSQGFLSFDISGIPAGSTITGVSFNLSDFDTLGNPFGDLGCLYLYQQDYGSLDAGDYFAGVPTGGLTRICGAGGLGSAVTDNDFITAVKSKVGTSRFQLRAQFGDTAVTADGEADMVRFGSIVMTVSYYAP